MSTLQSITLTKIADYFPVVDFSTVGLLIQFPSCCDSFMQVNVVI